MANTKIPSELIADSSITAAKLADGTITTADIADSNVTTAKIADSNVTTAKIGDAQVTTAKITDANVTTGKIADDAVTTAKMASNSVTSDTIASGITLAGTTTTGTLAVNNGDIDIKSGSSIHGSITATSNSLTVNARNTGILLFHSGGVEKMRMDNPGNLLIGTNSGTSILLHATGSRANGLAAQFTNTQSTNGSGIVVKGGNNSSTYSADFRDYNNNSLMRVRGDGNVGIATVNPSEKLQVGGNIALNGELKLCTAIRHANSGAQVIDNDNDTYFILNDPEGSNRIKIGDSGDASNTYRNTTHKFEPASGTEYMRINATGVGIGTNAPSSKLDVQQTTAGNIISAEFDNTDYTANNRNAIKIRQAVSSSGSYSAYLGSDKNTGNVFLSNDSITANHLVINTSGKVGIGTTSPASLLHVSGTSSSLLPLVDISNTSNSTAASCGLSVTGGGGSGSTGYQFRTKDEAGNVDFFIRGDGKVGIGTTAPQNNLDVGGGLIVDPTIRIDSAAGGSPTLIFDASQANRTASIKFYDNGSNVGGFIDYLHNGDKMNFGSGSSTNATLTVGDTVVGIGTTSPTAKLDVEGGSGGVSVRVKGDVGGGAYYYGYMFDGTNVRGTTQTNIFYSGSAIAANTTVAEYAGIRIDQPSTAASGAVVTNNYAIYSSGSAQKSYFAGKVGIGTTTPESNHAKANNLVVGGGGAGGMAVFNGTAEGWYAFSRANANNTDAYDGGMSYTDRVLRFHTNAGNTRFLIDASGDAQIYGNLGFEDSKLLMFGGGQDGRMFFDPSSNGFIITAANGTANNLHLKSNEMLLASAAGSRMFRGVANDTAELYYNGNKKLNTANTGVSITGDVSPSGTYGTSANNLDIVYPAGTGKELRIFRANGNTVAIFNEPEQLILGGGTTASDSATGLLVQHGSQTSKYGFRHDGAGKYMRMGCPNASFAYIETNATSGIRLDAAVSKASGSFRIKHPLPSKNATHDLVHSFIEGPQADNIYRGVTTLVGGSATINIDTVSGMTEGTYILLNTNTSCFTSNETDWDAVKGSVTGNILTITCKNASSTATVSWLVIGERHDQHMKDTGWTNSDGTVIVEPLQDVR